MTLKSGEVHLKKPSQEIYIKFIQFREKISNINDSETTQIFEVINDILYDILNHNTENKKITKDEIKKLPFEFKQLIMKEYKEFMNNIVERKN